jgi:acyl-homoserine lactone acylase PvdQ
LQEIANLVKPETSLTWKELTFLHNAFVNEDYSCSQYYNLTCLEFAKQSMVNTITKFRKVYGKVPLWGIVTHTAHFSPPAMLNTKLKCMVSRDVLVAGGTETINTAEPTDQDLITQDGVIYRQIIDMANNYQSFNEKKVQDAGTEDLTDEDKFVIPLGQSGNYFSPYFENLFKFWYNGEYIDMKMDGYQIRYKLLLRPN